ncbi:hypothetical protein PR001_g30327 [Phytophthora rubi]|uniref:Reverse transcriptase zinc-binding domain-containing protein n=1 Tax=Phytophthora rubi TaxID=129364 RepID=A0A6A3GUI3_9STRA|nr:hypothetical protein PR002_g30171 [Phytophthora rubi]KAE8960624.1 hypothetical protein PR001_g30327 [Phytophthora rubi]
MARFNLILPSDDPLPGPTRSVLVEAACHEWSLAGQLVVEMKNKDFVQLVLKARKDPKTPELQLQQLDAADFEPADDTWRKEILWDRHVLPVCADLKYRLQHNALGFLYKFGWRTQVATSRDCVHGCLSEENAKHLFWLCAVARFQWDYYLRPFHDLIEEDIDWQLVLFSTKLRLHLSTVRLYGDYAVQATFNIVRCCVFRALWLHRNKRLYNPEVSTSAGFVNHHASAYIQLHLRIFRAHAISKNKTKWAAFADHLAGVLKMPSISRQVQ